MNQKPETLDIFINVRNIKYGPDKNQKCVRKKRLRQLY